MEITHSFETTKISCLGIPLSLTASPTSISPWPSPYLRQVSIWRYPAFKAARTEFLTLFGPYCSGSGWKVPRPLPGIRASPTMKWSWGIIVRKPGFSCGPGVSLLLTRQQPTDFRPSALLLFGSWQLEFEPPCLNTPLLSHSVRCDEVRASISPKSLYVHHHSSSTSESTEELVSVTKCAIMPKSIQHKALATCKFTRVLSDQNCLNSTSPEL